MDEYEANHPDEPKKEDSGSSKRKAEDKPSKPAKKMDTRPKGFARGLTAEKIIVLWLPTSSRVGLLGWMNPADYMLKKRERARFPTG